VWTLQASSPPPEPGSNVPEDESMPCGRSGQGMVHYPADDKLVVFGGRNNKSADIDMNDLWSYDMKSKFWQRLSGIYLQSSSVLSIEKTSLKHVF